MSHFQANSPKSSDTCGAPSDANSHFSGPRPAKRRPAQLRNARHAASRLLVVPLLAGLLIALFPTRTGARAAPAPGVFGPGETLVYAVRYGPVRSGSARILVGSGASVDGRTVWPIVVQAKTSAGMSRLYDVHDRFVTLWDPATSASLGFDFHANEGGQRRFTQTRLDPATGVAKVVEQSHRGNLRKRSVSIGITQHDIASAVFWVRGRPLKTGDTETVGVFTGDKPWKLKAKVEGRELFESKRGTEEAIRVRFQTRFHGKLVARNGILVWFSADRAHVPLKIKADLILGSLNAELDAYYPGIATP